MEKRVKYRDEEVFLICHEGQSQGEMDGGSIVKCPNFFFGIKNYDMNLKLSFNKIKYLKLRK